MISISGSLTSSLSDRENEDLKNHLVVNSCGYQKFITKNYRIERNAGRVDYQIIYIIKGRGYYNFSGEIHEIDEGSVIVYRPGQPQHYDYHFNDSTELYWLHFTGCDVENYLAALGLLEKQYYYVDVNRDCIDILKRIISELQLKKPEFESLSSAYLLELFSVFSRQVTELKAGNIAADSAIKHVVALMHAKYSLKYTVSDFSDMCNLSLYRFIHKFKSLIGMTPVQYITKIRIDEAKYLLINSPLNITEISTIVGYDNPLYFSRVFHKVTGNTPSYFRNSSIKKPR